MRHTHTYAILEISKEAYQDIYARLLAAVGMDRMDDEFLVNDGVICFGTTAIKVEEHTANAKL